MEQKIPTAAVFTSPQPCCEGWEAGRTSLSGAAGSCRAATHPPTRDNSARKGWRCPIPGLPAADCSQRHHINSSDTQPGSRNVPVPRAMSGGGAWAVMGSQTPPLLPPLPPRQPTINSYSSPAEIINPSLPCLYPGFCCCGAWEGITALRLGGSQKGGGSQGLQRG